MDSSYFDCTVQIAAFKVVALVPLLLVLTCTIAILLGLYLEYYLKPILLAQDKVVENVLKLDGCFDSYVNADLTALKAESTKDVTLLSITTVLENTQYGLIAVVSVNVILWMYVVCCHRALKLFCNFGLLDRMIPSH